MPIEILVNGYEADLTADIAAATAAPFDISVSTLIDRWGVTVPDSGQFRALVGKPGNFELMVLARDGAAVGTLRCLERGIEGTVAIDHDADDAAVKVKSIATVEGLAVFSRAGRIPAESFGWDAMAYDPAETNADTGALSNTTPYVVEIPYRGRKSLTHVGFQVRTNLASGITAAELGIYTLEPGDSLIRRQGAVTDISSFLTTAGFKEIALTGGPIVIPWEPGFRMWVAIRQDATSRAGFRCRDKMDAAMQNGAMRQNPYPMGLFTNGALATSYASMIGRDNNWLWVGVR